MENKVFKRTDATGEIISPAQYNLTIGAVLCWGFFVNWLMVKHIDPAAIMAVNPWIFVIGYFALCFFGIYLFNKSNNPAISFLGYNFVVVPFGLIVNIVVHTYDRSWYQKPYVSRAWLPLL